ncbi:MAG: hypothetical protein V4573_05420 [Pseudomonadota bacterium]
MIIKQFIDAVNADRWIWTAVAIVGVVPLLVVVAYIAFDATRGFQI